jgi:hypothetical protein
MLTGDKSDVFAPRNRAPYNSMRPRADSVRDGPVPHPAIAPAQALRFAQYLVCVCTMKRSRQIPVDVTSLTRLASAARTDAHLLFRNNPEISGNTATAWKARPKNFVARLIELLTFQHLIVDDSECISGAY